jgi:hypothetical protein
MTTHFILVTHDGAEFRVAYSDIRPYTWWVKAYVGEGQLKPVVLRMHADGWPVHLIGRPALIVTEFMKIFTGLLTRGQAWSALPLPLENAGYSILQWRRCLTFHGLDPEKRTRDADDEDVEYDMAQPPRKKARKGEIQMNPVEQRVWNVGTALGKHVRDNHPKSAAFLKGDTARLDVEFVVPLRDADLKATADGEPASYEIAVPNVGIVNIYEYVQELALGLNAVFCTSLAAAIHPSARASCNYWSSERAVPTASLADIIRARGWPANEEAAVDGKYLHNTVKGIHFVIAYAMAPQGKKKR